MLMIWATNTVARHVSVIHSNVEQTKNAVHAIMDAFVSRDLIGTILLDNVSGKTSKRVRTTSNAAFSDPCHKDNTQCSRFAACDKTSNDDGTFDATCTCNEGKVGDGFSCHADKCHNGKHHQHHAFKPPKRLHRGSNPGPLHYKCSALPLSYRAMNTGHKWGINKLT